MRHKGLSVSAFLKPSLPSRGILVLLHRFDLYRLNTVSVFFRQQRIVTFLAPKPHSYITVSGVSFHYTPIYGRGLRFPTHPVAVNSNCRDKCETNPGTRELQMSGSALYKMIYYAAGSASSTSQEKEFG
jgi:hypothetical protein